MIALAALPSDDRARRLAAEILGREEYTRPRQALDSLAHLTDWLRWLDRLFGLGDLIETNPLLYYLILAALLITAAALITHLVYSIRRALTWATPAPRRATEDGGPRFSDEAEALARQGHFLEAARRLQLGVLETLLQTRRLELSRSDANRVLRRRLAEAHLAEGERRDLLQLLDRFETSWFRDRQEDAGLYEGWRSLYLRLARGGTTA